MVDLSRFYRVLLKLYPARFREEFEGPLERQFADEYREASTRSARAAFLLRALADFALTLPPEIGREVRQDLSYAARVYRRRAVVTGLALTALALAIGATTGVFSVVNALLLRSLPFREPERIVQVQTPSVPPLAGRPQFYAWRDSNPSLADVAAYFPTEMNLGLAGQSARLPIAETSANFFALLGGEPQFGRGFAADEDMEGRDGVAVIAFSVWQQFFGGDPRVLGQTIHLNGAPLTVIGVAPPAFDFPGKTAVWTPTVFDFQRVPLQGVFYGDTVGRLKPGLSLPQARTMFEAEARRLIPDSFTRAGRLRPSLIPLQERLAGTVRQASLVLLGVVAFVLLIACANVAHLLLSRVAERRRELMIRGALGASRARLVQQLITESTLLTAASAAAGLGVAHWAARLAAMTQPGKLASQVYTVLDTRVLLFSVGVALITGLVFGVLPALLIGRLQLAMDPLRSQPGSRGSGAGRMRAALVVLQAAFTLVLLAGSIIMGRSFLRLLRTDLGYRTANVVTLNVSLAGTRWESAHIMAQYYNDALQRLRTVPGVDSAAAVQFMPLIESFGMGSTFELDSSHNSSIASTIAATTDYFRTMGTDLVEGREFNAADRANSERVAVVNEEFVRRVGAGPHLVGRRITAKWPPGAKAVTIVGIVRTARAHGPSDPGSPQIFFPAEQWVPGFVTFVARVRGNVEPYLPVCRDAVQQVDGKVPVYDVKTLDERLSDNLARPRFYTTAVLFLGGFALLLALVGIYGVASYSITQRTHEIGVRIAVGAPSPGVRLLLARQSLLPMLLGLAGGIFPAVALGKYLQHLIDSAQVVDAQTCGAAASLLAAFAAVAVWSATRRVTRVDPMAALRAE